MMRLSLTLISLAFSLNLFAQINSDCNIPPELKEAYDKDVKGLVVKRMQDLNSPDQSLIKIPQIWQDSILKGMAAIYNAPDFPYRDSIYDLYCIHDNAFSPALLGFIIGIDPNSSIAEAWESGSTLSGDPILDTLLTKYNFELTNYFSFGAGVFYTDQYLNLFALADSIVNNVPSVTYAEPDYLIGGAGKIDYATDGVGNQLFDFRLEWNDCFDGCDNFYTWKFKVGEACTVEFLGTEEGGVFGLEDLPEPSNCMITDIETPKYSESVIHIFPNPAREVLNFLPIQTETRWTIFNNQGQWLKEGYTTTGAIPLVTINPGIYWVKLSDEEGKTLSFKSFIKH